MADTPLFQGHHIIEQQAFRDSRLLRELSRRGMFDLDGASNLLNLPADRSLAAQLGVSLHPGGPLREYSNGLRESLDDLESGTHKAFPSEMRNGHGKVNSFARLLPVTPDRRDRIHFNVARKEFA